MIRIILLLAALMVPIAARADDRPLPVPSRGSVCPAGFSFSPTSGYCTPNPGTKAQAIPKEGSRPARAARTRACSRSASKSDVRVGYIG